MLMGLGLLVVVVAALRHHVAGEVALLAGVANVAMLAGRWPLRDLRAHPEPHPGHGLRMAVTAADGRRARSRSASQYRIVG
jgi:hypothetical protein